MAVPGFLAAASAPAPSASEGASDPQTVVLDAMAKAYEIPRQAQALVDLAWPAKDGDPAVAAEARRRIIGFGEKAMDALWEAACRVRPDQQADLVDAAIDARKNINSGVPLVFLAALTDTLWCGTREAKRLAIPVLGYQHYRPALLPIIDSVVDDRELLGVGIQALGVMGSDQSRFFLERVLNEEKSAARESAAVALARIGGRATASLKTALRSQDRAVRLAAVRALLPVAGTDDISSLYEFYERHSDDDPATAQSVHEAAAHLEKILEMQRNAEMDRSHKDF